jgi:hypothetical protein
MRRAEEVDLNPSRGFVDQMTHFMACLREDRTPITSPEEQIGSLRAIWRRIARPRRGGSYR